VTNHPGSAPDRTVISAEVQEQSTGEFSVGVGFSTTDGPLADIGIRERNLLGRGQDLRIGALVAQRTQQIDLSFTEPYFLDRNLSAGFDLFALVRDNQDIAGFSQQSIGGSLRAGYQITEPLRQTLKYTLRQDRIFDVASTASTFIQQQVGSRVTSSVGQVLLYDKRDNRLDPTAGWFASLGNEVAGLGGDVRYLRTTLSGGYYYSVATGYVLSVTAEGGYIFGLSDNVRIEDRFFVGGDNLRGFANGGIGPRDSITRDALGGNIYYVGSVALGFPLGLPQELGLSGRVFSDFGSLWKIDQPTTTATTATVLDVKSIRISAGAGVSWQSPLGPIRIDIGVPVKRESFDKTEVFRVSFGTRF
jgi:outer membrane protein insertion porin family